MNANNSFNLLPYALLTASLTLLYLALSLYSFVSRVDKNLLPTDDERHFCGYKGLTDYDKLYLYQKQDNFFIKRACVSECPQKFTGFIKSFPIDGHPNGIIEKENFYPSVQLYKFCVPLDYSIAKYTSLSSSLDFLISQVLYENILNYFYIGYHSTFSYFLLILPISLALLSIYVTLSSKADLLLSKLVKIIFYIGIVLLLTLLGYILYSLKLNFLIFTALCVLIGTVGLLCICLNYQFNSENSFEFLAEKPDIPLGLSHYIISVVIFWFYFSLIILTILLTMKTVENLFSVSESPATGYSSIYIYFSHAWYTQLMMIYEVLAGAFLITYFTNAFQYNYTYYVYNLMINSSLAELKSVPKGIFNSCFLNAGFITKAILNIRKTNYFYNLVRANEYKPATKDETAPYIYKGIIAIFFTNSLIYSFYLFRANYIFILMIFFMWNFIAALCVNFILSMIGILYETSSNEKEYKNVSSEVVLESRKAAFGNVQLTELTGK